MAALVGLEKEKEDDPSTSEAEAKATRLWLT